MMRGLVFASLLVLNASTGVFAGNVQDTVLVAVLNLGYPVNSVFNGEGGRVFLTGAKGLEKRIDSGEFEGVDELQTTPVFWAESRLVDGNEWVALYNQDPFEGGKVWRRYFGRDALYSEARVDSVRSLVCDGYRLFEVEFRSTDGVFLEGKSIRGFRWVQGELVANSYQGVFLGGERLLNLDFNDGSVIEFEDQVFSFGQFVLRWPVGQVDQLEVIHRPDSIQHEGTSYYDRRDGVVWNERLWWYSFGRFGVFEEDIWKVLTTEIDVLTAVPLKEELLLASRREGVWRFDGNRFESMGWPEGIEYYDVKAVDEERFLVATNHGLAIANQRTGDFELQSIDEGIPSASVCSIERDAWGTFWVSTFSGVIRYSLEHGVIEHHAPLVEFNRFSRARTPDGQFAFGSTRGIYTFAPAAPDLPSPSVPVEWLLGLLGVALVAGIWIRRLRVLQRKEQEAASNERVAAWERQALVAQIREGIYRDVQGASSDSVADQLGMSRRTLYRKCAEFDIKPSALIREIRIESARKLMDQGELTFQEVASRVGYSPNHLRRVLNGEE